MNAVDSIFSFFISNPIFTFRRSMERQTVSHILIIVSFEDYI